MDVDTDIEFPDMEIYDEFIHSAEWRANVLARDKWLCRICKKYTASLGLVTNTTPPRMIFVAAVITIGQRSKRPGKRHCARLASILARVCSEIAWRVMLTPSTSTQNAKR
jgi:hypothetical protein